MSQTTVASEVPAFRLRWWLIGFGFATANGLVQVAYRWLDVLARGRMEPVGRRLVEELTSSYGILLLVPGVVWWTRRIERRHAGWFARIVWHVPVLALFSVLHTTWNAVMRPVAARLTGIGAYDYGNMPVRYLMEFSIHIIVYATIVACVLLFDARQASRERAARLARVEAELASAQVRALEARLQPHFLFNALNTISSVMYTDPAAADTMLSRLADLLRRTLRTEQPEIALGDELETMELWLDVMRARFSDRMHVSVNVDRSLRAALVPPLVLQPLLENAFEHGAPGAGQITRVVVSAQRAKDTLRLEVRDNGPGLRVSEHDALTRGIGLSTTRERLHSLYGDAASIAFDDAPEGGLCVRIALPWRIAAHDEPRPAQSPERSTVPQRVSVA